MAGAELFSRGLAVRFEPEMSLQARCCLKKVFRCSLLKRYGL